MDHPAPVALLFWQRWGKLSQVAAPCSRGPSLAGDATLPKPLPACQALSHSSGRSLVMAPPPWGSQHPPSPPENSIKSFILNKEVHFLMLATVHVCMCVWMPTCCDSVETVAAAVAAAFCRSRRTSNMWLFCNMALPAVMTLTVSSCRNS